MTSSLLSETPVARVTSPHIAAALRAAQTEAAEREWMRGKRFDTIAVHGVYGLEAMLEQSGSLIEPAYLSAAQVFPDSATMEAALAYEMPSWTYSRIANPTVHFLEETLGLLEGYGSGLDVRACATGSGMAAIFMATSPFLTVASGSRRPNIVASARCYGGTFMLFSERYAAERGVDVRWVRDPLDTEAWATLIDDETRFVFGEMPSNPGLAVFDVEAVARAAHAHGAPLIVDSTVASPALLRPLAHGADIVVHSVSKVLAGSGRTIAGAVLSRPDIVSDVIPGEARADFATWMKLHPFRDHGPALHPMGALMALDDIRSLRDRVDRMSRSAMAVARHLAAHPAIASVAYPGLAEDPGHAVACRYLRLADAEGEAGERFGFLLGFTLHGGTATARRAFDHLRLIRRATDLGRVKSVATMPSITTHQQQGEAGRRLAAIPDGLVRLSIGLEDPADLIDDLERALAVA